MLHLARLAAPVAAALLLATAATTTAHAAPRDPGGFRNVLAGGQGTNLLASQLGALPSPFTSQLAMWRDLVPAAPELTDADLPRFFKAERFGVAPADRGRVERPRPGVRIVRDRTHNVPSVFGRTRDDVFFGSGYAQAQDRLFLMDALRHRGRAQLTSLTGTLGGSSLDSDADRLLVADYAERDLRRMLRTLPQRHGADGRRVLADLRAFSAGVNAVIAQTRRDPALLPAEYGALGTTPRPWRATDTLAVTVDTGLLLGYGGGREADKAMMLQAARERFGRRAGDAVFADFAAIDDPEAPVTTTKRFRYPSPGARDPRASALLDPGSFERVRPDDPIRATGASIRGAGPAWARGLAAPASPAPASNALLVAADRSATGRPIMVAGPQVGQYVPQGLVEIDLHGGGIHARGATVPGQPYVLLGRGTDFAWSGTVARADSADQFAERLCEPDGSRPTRTSAHYVRDGRCVPMRRVRHVLRPPGGEPIALEGLRTVHGPVQGTATVGGRPVAIAFSRSTYRHEIDAAPAFAALNAGEVRSAQDFRRVMADVSLTVNWLYVDRRRIGYVHSGWIPRRAQGTDPQLPAWGTGRWDWQGFRPRAFSSSRLAASRMPWDVDPSAGYLVSWNNRAARGWRAPDALIDFNGVHRSTLLSDPLRRLARRGRVTRAEVVRVMAEAATQDLRGVAVVPTLLRALGTPRDPRAARAAELLAEWVRTGSHRRDLDGDGAYDHSAAVALMDAWWPALVDAVYLPVLGEDLFARIRALNPVDLRPDVLADADAYFAGWYGYVERDVAGLLGDDGERYSRRYCGATLAACRAVLRRTLAEAYATVTAARGADPAAWRVPTTCEQTRPRGCDQVVFQALGAASIAPVPFQNRVTFQQVVSVGAR